MNTQFLYQSFLNGYINNTAQSKVSSNIEIYNNFAIPRRFIFDVIPKKNRLRFSTDPCFNGSCTECCSNNHTIFCVSVDMNINLYNYICGENYISECEWDTENDPEGTEYYSCLIQSGKDNCEYATRNFTGTINYYYYKYNNITQLFDNESESSLPIIINANNQELTNPYNINLDNNITYFYDTENKKHSVWFFSSNDYLVGVIEWIDGCDVQNYKFLPCYCANGGPTMDGDVTISLTSSSPANNSFIVLEDLSLQPQPC